MGPLEFPRCPSRGRTGVPQRVSFGTKKSAREIKALARPECQSTAPLSRVVGKTSRPEASKATTAGWR